MSGNLIITEVHTHKTISDGDELKQTEDVEFLVWKTEEGFARYEQSLIRLFGQPTEHATIKDTCKKARLEMYIFYTNYVKNGNECIRKKRIAWFCRRSA